MARWMHMKKYPQGKWIKNDAYDVLTIRLLSRSPGLHLLIDVAVGPRQAVFDRPLAGPLSSPWCCSFVHLLLHTAVHGLHWLSLEMGLTLVFLD